MTSPQHLLLEFAEVWKDLASKNFSYVDTKMDSSQPATLEHLRQITALRAAISKGAMSVTATSDRIERIETYLEYLAAFGEAHPSPASLEFDWSWPLGGKPDSFMRVPGLASEHAEVLQLYAAGMRQAAHEVMASLPASPAPSTDEEAAAAPALEGDIPASHPQAAGMLRAAAGVYKYLEQHLAELGYADGRSFEWRPPELVPGVAAGLAMLSLAEAQAVTAHRAEQRGSGPALVAALHVGTADLLEEAARATKDASDKCKGAPERLKKLLALGWSLAVARARRAWAAAEADDGQAGSAVAGINEGISILQDCQSIANEDYKWQEVWADEMAQLKKAHAKMDQLRESVHFQRVAKAAAPLPGGKCLVKVVAYELPPTNLSLFDVASLR